MKKIMLLCFSIFFSIMSILSVLNYAFEAEEQIELDKQTILIERPETMQNDEYLTAISEVMEQIHCDIMYKYTNVTGKKTEYLYYKTNNTSNFVTVPSEKKNMLVISGECISTKLHEGYINYKLNTANAHSDISFFDLSDAVNYSLDSAIYYVKASECEQITEALHSAGLYVEKKYSSLISGKYSVILFGGIPIILFFASMLFYVLSEGKKIVLKKMDGYSNFDILKDDVSDTLPQFGIIFLIISVITGIAGAICYPLALNGFLSYFLGYVGTGAFITALGYALALIVYFSKNNAEQIKGKAPKTGIYTISIFLKICFVLFIMFFMSIAVRNVTLAYHTFRTSKTFAEKLDSYVTVPVYNLNHDVDGLETNYVNLYHQTVDAYHGVLIDAGNYKFDLISGKTPCEEYGQDDIIINENYLSFNPIYDLNGTAITPEQLTTDGRLNVLIPLSKKDSENALKERYLMAYKTDINIIYYDESISKIYSYNASALATSDGEIKSPVVVLADEKIINETFIYTFITNGYYFFKATTSDPTAEFKPLLEELGISETTLKLNYVSDNFKEEMTQWLSMLKLYATQSALLLLGMLTVILFTSKLYCENYKNRISIYLMEGKSLLFCIRNHIAFTLLSYVFCIAVLHFGITISISFNYNIMIFMILSELIIILLSCRKFVTANLSEILKGAD